jgi:glycosyltransferase involved in cell wall biosynthesis
MIHLFVNAWAASAGGGLTYVRNVLPHLAARKDVQVTLLVNASLRQELRPWDNVKTVDVQQPSGVARRFWFEQRSLPELLRRSGADVLLSTGNFALRGSPVPQILLSRNALYTSRDYYEDLKRRGEYSLWLDTRMKGWLARRSLKIADVTVAPSAAFAEELRRWTGKDVIAIHHGFDPGLFFQQSKSLPVDVQAKLDASEGCLRLLFVSHYNYYRNFETLLKAVPLLQKHLPKRRIRLLLTCNLHSGKNSGSYHSSVAATLVSALGISENIVDLGEVPYESLHLVYRACHLYVTPAYAESFAHPLVEAMASGLPIVASSLKVHREICGDAAKYFSPFSQPALADEVASVVRSVESARAMREKGLQRAQEFSWCRHVDDLLQVARNLLDVRRSPNAM